MFYMAALYFFHTIKSDFTPLSKKYYFEKKNALAGVLRHSRNRILQFFNQNLQLYQIQELCQSIRFQFNLKPK